MATKHEQLIEMLRTAGEDRAADLAERMHARDDEDDSGGAGAATEPPSVVPPAIMSPAQAAEQARQAEGQALLAAMKRDLPDLCGGDR